MGFNWRMKYLMIYLTKQIVQLPLGFDVVLLCSLHANLRLVKSSLDFFRCACGYLITDYAMKHEENNSGRSLFIMHRRGKKILNYPKRLQLICLLMLCNIFDD